MELIQSYLTENPCYQANLLRADGRYAAFQDEGPKGLMLHSVGCAQPSAEVFVKKWNRATYNNACVHAFLDANTGAVWQTLPWNFRGWHCGSGKNGSANNTHCGIEMCESRYVKYTGGASFTVLDAALAKADCERTYAAAVELFAALCEVYSLDPTKAILSHKEGGKLGLASGHVDPEHFWQGLGMPYTMDGFRTDVKARLEAASAPTGPIYRVQVGAFRNRAYAEAYLDEVRAHFPLAYIRQE
jgi:hypothetical protein